MTSEQRRFPRIPLNEETIYFLSLDAGAKHERIYSPAVITDISKGGVGMRVGVDHKVNDQIWLEGIAELTGAQPGYVKWVKNSGDEHYYIGVEFEGIKS